MNTASSGPESGPPTTGRPTTGRPITAEMVARSTVVADPRWSPDGSRVGWVEARGDGTVLVVAPADGSAAPAVVTADPPVAPTRFPGGGAWCWAGSAGLVYAAADGRLMLASAAGGPARVLAGGDGRALAPAATRDGTRVAFVLDRTDACDVVMVRTDEVPAGGHVAVGALVAVSGTADGRADWAWDPTWSEDGTLLAWHEWDLPNMPWDGSRIVVAAVDDDGVHDRRIVAGGDAVAVGQPRFSPVGDALAYVSDESGWSNVWTTSPDGSDRRPLVAEEHEHSEPAWGAGQRSFAWSPDGAAIVLNRNEDGFGRLVVARRGAAPRSISRGWHHGLDWGRPGIVTLRSGARTPSTITVLDASGDRDRRRELAGGPVAGFEATGLAEPEAVSWAGADGEPVHGLLWRPTGARTSDPAGDPAGNPEGSRERDRPPMLVDVHGGPTAQATGAWNPRPHYFASRGIAVLQPNARGSSGYGRAYRDALSFGWGETDVADVLAGILAAGERGWCDPGRVAVAGGSAGGFTALLVCIARADLVRAAVVQYPVCDLLELAATTHRFESRYADRLVGPLPAANAVYSRRSPLTHAASLRTPLLVLHGDADEVVSRAQVDHFVGAVRAGGGTVEQVTYPGEGHGWSRPDTVVDALRRTEAFLDRALTGGFRA